MHGSAEGAQYRERIALVEFGGQRRGVGMQEMHDQIIAPGVDWRGGENFGDGFKGGFFRHDHIALALRAGMRRRRRQ